jgi:hypothetical protein
VTKGERDKGKVLRSRSRFLLVEPEPKPLRDAAPVPTAQVPDNGAQHGKMLKNDTEKLKHLSTVFVHIKILKKKNSTLMLTLDCFKTVCSLYIIGQDPEA